MPRQIRSGASNIIRVTRIHGGDTFIAEAVYDDKWDVWTCTSSHDPDDIRETTDAWAELQDMLTLAITQ